MGRKVKVKIDKPVVKLDSDLKINMQIDDLNGSLERLRFQVELVREQKKIKKSARSVQTSNASDHKNGTKIAHEDLKLERLSLQLGLAREQKEIKKSARSVQTSNASDQEYGTNIVSCEDFNLSVDSATARFFNTSTPKMHSKTKLRYSKKKTGRRKQKIVKSSLKLEQNKEQPFPDRWISSKLEIITSMLDLSLPTPSPPRDMSEPLSISYDANLMDDSSSDEDLPVGLTPLKLDKPFSKDDIVWVKWKNWPHLPALVKKVYKKRKRLTLSVFTPSGFEDDFTMSYGHPGMVVHYYDPKKNDILAESEKLNKTDKEYFKGSYANAENFLTRELLKGIGETEENPCNEEIIEKENDSEEEKKVCNKRQQLSSDFDHIISEVKKKKGPSEKGQKRIERMSEETKPLTELLVSKEKEKTDVNRNLDRSDEDKDEDPDESDFLYTKEKVESLIEIGIRRVSDMISMTDREAPWMRRHNLFREGGRASLIGFGFSLFSQQALFWVEKQLLSRFYVDKTRGVYIKHGKIIGMCDDDLVRKFEKDQHLALIYMTQVGVREALVSIVSTTLHLNYKRADMMLRECEEKSLLQALKNGIDKRAINKGRWMETLEKYSGLKGSF